MNNKKIAIIVLFVVIIITVLLSNIYLSNLDSIDYVEPKHINYPFINHTYDGSNFTAFEGFNITYEYMSSHYTVYSLNKIGPTYNNTGYNEYWDYSYTIYHEDNQISGIESIRVYSNGTILTHYTPWEELKMHRRPPNTQEIDIELLNIDSNDAADIINEIAKNEEWYFFDDVNFELYLSAANNKTLGPIWFGQYSFHGDNGYSFFNYFISANTGEVI
jgi:hypothetical protein